jgi:hypothetical protein
MSGRRARPVHHPDVGCASSLLRPKDVEVSRRVSAIGGDPDSVHAGGLTGSPAEVLDRLGTFAEAGAACMYLQLPDLSDLDHLELLAAEVLPSALRL